MKNLSYDYNTKNISLPSDTIVSNSIIRHSIRRDESIFIAVRHHLVDESHHCDAVAPRVLEIDAGQPVCREYQAVSIGMNPFNSRFVTDF